MNQQVLASDDDLYETCKFGIQNLLYLFISRRFSIMKQLHKILAALTENNLRYLISYNLIQNCSQEIIQLIVEVTCREDFKSSGIALKIQNHMNWSYRKLIGI